MYTAYLEVIFIKALVLFCRYMSQGKHAEARELMYSGALLFFSHNQVSHSFCVCGLGRGVLFQDFEGWMVNSQWQMFGVIAL